MPERGLDQIKSEDFEIILDDDLAKQEERQLYHAKQGREERERRHLHRLFLGALWGISIVAMLSVLVLAWHVILPKSYRWLDADDLERLRTILGSAVFGGIVSPWMARKLKSKLG
jgi:hypothetical protein